MPVYFISDLHLDAKSPQLTHLFQELLTDKLADAEALYILGDLFEAWIGDDDLTPFNQNIMQQLSLAAKRFPIYILPGNRDFLLGEKFARACGITLLKDPTVINVYGNKILILHGDSLCTQDKSYQRFRKLIRNSYINRWFLMLPLKLRQKIAARLREKSQQMTKSKSEQIMDVTFSEIPKILDKYQTGYMIYGHTHRPSIYYRFLNGNCYTACVLSDWGKQANALKIYANGEKHLLYF